MKNKYFFDTSIVIDYIKGKSQIVNFVQGLRGESSTSYIVLSELYEGIFRSKNEIEEKILGYFETFDKIYGIDKYVSREFGKIRANLRKSGNKIEDLDIFIAATCIANNLILITHNKKHFTRIKELKVISPEDKIY